MRPTNNIDNIRNFIKPPAMPVLERENMDFAKKLQNLKNYSSIE
jgi:hypothetical protein